MIPKSKASEIAGEFNALMGARGGNDLVFRALERKTEQLEMKDEAFSLLAVLAALKFEEEKTRDFIRKALALNPSSTFVRMQSSTAAGILGYQDEAKRIVEKIYLE